MGQEIVTSNLPGSVSDPDGSQSAADQTGTSSTLDFVNPRTWFDVRIAQKTFTAGTGTALPRYRVDVADDSAFSTNLRRIGSLQFERSSNQTHFQRCFVYDGAKRYCRIVPVLDGTDTVNYDVKVQAS